MKLALAFALGAVSALLGMQSIVSAQAAADQDISAIIVSEQRLSDSVVALARGHAVRFGDRAYMTCRVREYRLIDDPPHP